MAHFQPHSDKQELALFAHDELGVQIVIAATGIQWGKTKIGSMWLKLRMHRHTAVDDNFIITSPSFPILEQSTLPPFLQIMDGYGRYDKKANCFRMYKGGTCWFRTNTNPDSIVGITNVRAILCDELGLYTLYFWENILGRAAFKSAEIMGVTSPYSLNFLYKDIIRPKQKSPKNRPDVCLIQARSDENPYFPKDQYESRKKTMDPRRFNMMFGGQFDKMQGLVFMGFDEEENQCDPFELPMGTTYVAGIDWGFTHPFVLKVRAITPDGTHFQVSEFYETQTEIRDIVLLAKQKKAVFGIKQFYADPSRPDMISLFNQEKLPCVGAKNDIKEGIEVHRDLINTRKFKIFRGQGPHTIDEYDMYHYPSPKDLKPDQADIDPDLPVDANNHACDVDRYISIMTHKITKRVLTSNVPMNPDRMAHDQVTEWLKRKHLVGQQTENW